MLSVLNDTQQGVVEAIRMRLNTNQALKHLEELGHPISRATYFRHRKRLEEMKLRRLYHIAKIGFQDQHLERIDKCEMIERLMWQNFREEKSPFKRNLILRDIIGIQPYLSSYYEATENVMKESELMKRYHIPELEYKESKEV